MLSVPGGQEVSPRYLIFNANHVSSQQVNVMRDETLNVWPY